MAFSAQSGTVADAQKVVLYGPEGVGKTSLAAKFPWVLFIDTEGSTKQYPVRRLTLPDGSTKPNDWNTLLDMISAVRDGEIEHVKTLVIDSLDWAEMLCIRQVCEKANKDGVEDFGYGKGYVYVKEEFQKLLNLLSSITERGMHVVCTAHAQLRKVELPEETGSYDHWEMKMEKRDAALVKEWADAVLFLNYKTIVIQGATPMEKNKAAGGKRMMYTTHTPWWDAKNRYGLPEDLPLDYNNIGFLFDSLGNKPVQEPPKKKPEQKPEPTIFAQPDNDLPFYDGAENLPDELKALMAKENMSVKDLEAAVCKAGCYPEGTTTDKYTPEFMDYLVSIWEQVAKLNKKIKEEITNG